MSQFTQNALAEILKAGKSTPNEWLTWKEQFRVAPDDVKTGIAELVAGKKIKGHPMSNSFPTLKKRYYEQTDAINEMEKETLAPLGDQEQAKDLVSKLMNDMNLLSQVMPPQQSEEVFYKLKDLLNKHLTRLIPYTALCVQRSIVETYEEETRSTLVNNLQEEISQLEEQEDYYKKQVNGGAPTDDAKKIALEELRKTRIKLESKRTELIEKKGGDTVFDPSDANNFATQQYGNDDDEDEEETEQQKLLNLKQKLKDEYESRGSKKRKASSSAPDGAIVTPPKKQKSWFGFLWGESEEA